MKRIILYQSSQLKKVSVTGGVRRFKELLNHLGDYCDLTLVSGDISYDVPNGVKHISMHHTDTASSEIVFAKWNRKYLKQIKKHNDYDWIIAFDVPPAFGLALIGMPHLCLMVRKDFIGYEKITLSERKYSKIKKWLVLLLFSLAEWITLCRSEKIIVQCEYDKNELIKRHKLSANKLKNKIFVQINNVNPSWATVSDKPPMRINDDKMHICSINGFNDLRKGCDLFLKATSRIIDRGYPIKVYIAGEGGYLESYKKQYKDYSDIIFCGRIEHPSDFLSNMELSVVPSRADSCPNTVMESIYNDIPVIASNVGGIPEILSDTEALFQPDIDSLEEAIVRYLDSNNRSQLLYRQKQRKNELTFDWCLDIFHIIAGDL